MLSPLLLRHISPLFAISPSQKVNSLFRNDDPLPLVCLGEAERGWRCVCVCVCVCFVGLVLYQWRQQKVWSTGLQSCYHTFIGLYFTTTTACPHELYIHLYTINALIYSPLEPRHGSCYTLAYPIDTSGVCVRERERQSLNKGAECVCVCVCVWWVREYDDVHYCYAVCSFYVLVVIFFKVYTYCIVYTVNVYVLCTRNIKEDSS